MAGKAILSSETFPNEILLEMLKIGIAESFFDIPDLKNIRLVSKRFY